jgi:hypothetical protein
VVKRLASPNSVVYWWKYDTRRLLVVYDRAGAQWRAKSPWGWLTRNRGVSRDAVLAPYDLSECNHSARIEKQRS